MLSYTLEGWNIENGKQVEQVVLTIHAKDEDEAHERVKTAAPRQYYETVAVEDAPLLGLSVEETIGSGDQGAGLAEKMADMAAEDKEQPA